jgi:hypothetical protein
MDRRSPQPPDEKQGDDDDGDDDAKSASDLVSPGEARFGRRGSALAASRKDTDKEADRAKASAGDDRGDAERERELLPSLRPSETKKQLRFSPATLSGAEKRSRRTTRRAAPGIPALPTIHSPSAASNASGASSSSGSGGGAGISPSSLSAVRGDALDEQLKNFLQRAETIRLKEERKEELEHAAVMAKQADAERGTSGKARAGVLKHSRTNSMKLGGAASLQPISKSTQATIAAPISPLRDPAGTMLNSPRTRHAFE